MHNTLPVDPPVRLLALYQQVYPDTKPDIVFQAPGREMWALANITERGEYAITSSEMAARAVFSRQSAKVRRTVLQRPLPRWARYAAGMVLLLDDAGLAVPGLEAVVCADEPPGPRYDYALGILVAALWHDLYRRAVSPDMLREITDTVRREYVEVDS